MSGPNDLYKYRAVLLPWTVRGLDEVSGVLTGSFAMSSAWHDGDTFNALVSRGEHDYLLTHVRCAGYNAPEITGHTKAEGVAARNYATGLVDTGGVVYLDSLAFSAGDEEDDFGRMLAAVTLSDGRDLSSLMIDSGNAVSDPA